MRKLTVGLILAALGWGFAEAAQGGEGVRPKAMEVLPLGRIQPTGWLRLQLEKQRDGLTGHAEELYGDIGKSDWLTGEHKGGECCWERGPYYAKGLVALALTLHDEELTARAKRWVDAILASQREDGDFGPKKNNWWANMVVLHFMRDWAAATGDERVLPFLERYFAYQRTTLPEQTMIKDSHWALCRTGDELEVLLWAYERTGKSELVDLARLIVAQSADWTNYYYDGGDGAGTNGYRSHIVNFQQALKYPVLKWRLGGDERDRDAYAAACSEEGWAMRMHGRVDRMVNGTEPLAGREPYQGTELCAIAERILSCQNVIEATGLMMAADDLEIVGYNSLPACIGDDGRGIRYYMVLNQPRCTKKGGFGFVHNGIGNSTTPGPDAGFGCCRSNYHFAWPKFVQSMWMRKDGGLAAVAYGPCRVETDVATIVEGGGYPFGDTVTLTVEKTKDAAWPLAVRIPGWTSGADVQVNGVPVNGAVRGQFCTIRRVWKAGDVVTLRLSAENRTFDGTNGAISVRRGPLVYALGLKASITNVVGKGEIRKQFPAREYRATEEWNWALRRSALATAKPVFAEKIEDPFLHGATPAVLSVPARRTSCGGWGTMTYGYALRACNPPPCPVKGPLGEDGEVRLVPIGATQVRMAILPWFE